MSIAVNALIGAEQVQRAAFLQLYNNLNPAITEMQDFMQPSDEALAIATDRDYTPTTIELVDPEDFYEGHRPSLISAPTSAYPNCCVYITRSTPAPGADNYDHQTGWLDLLVVDVMVKSYVDESEINRRIKRTVEAVNVALHQDVTLGGVTHGFTSAPSVLWGEVFTRKEQTAYGEHLFFQGARVEYSVRKEATMPTASGEFAGLGIDQG